MCDHLAVELPTEPQSTAPSATGTKGATQPTMTQRTVERDQSRTTCDHLAVTEDRLTTDGTSHQDKDTADKEDQRQGARVSCLLRSDKRVHLNKCVNKLLVQALDSCPSTGHPTCCSVSFSTFFCGNLKSAGIANVYAKNWVQYSASHVATTALFLSQNGQKQSQSI